jgi:hypothetical protein
MQRSTFPVFYPQSPARGKEYIPAAWELGVHLKLTCAVVISQTPDPQRETITSTLTTVISNLKYIRQSSLD